MNSIQNLAFCMILFEFLNLFDKKDIEGFKFLRAYEKRASGNQSGLKHST